MELKDIVSCEMCGTLLDVKQCNTIHTPLTDLVKIVAPEATEIHFSCRPCREDMCNKYNAHTGGG